MAAYRYWQHFLALEADFAATARFVEIDAANYLTFSVEYTKLLLAACSEIDVLCKVACEKIDPSADRDDINDYRACLTAHTKIADEEVLVRRYNQRFKPWESWNAGRNPEWWRSYNNVKHERHVHFAKANLKNCLHAFGGLFVAVLYAHKAEGMPGDLDPGTELLNRDQEPGLIAYASGYPVPDFF